MEDFEGLVISTARLYAKQLHMEEEDLAQELRIKVSYALQKHNPARSSCSVKSYVFGCLTNRVKDMKRNAAREMRRRIDYGIEFTYIEDNSQFADDRDLFNCATHDEVYGRVDEGLFALPSTLTDAETRVLLLLMDGWSNAETALRLGLTRWQLGSAVTRLKLKLADWSPDCAPEVATRAVASVELALAAAA